MKALVCLLGGFLAVALPAQDVEELKRIAAKVDEELQAIDKLLQQSAKKAGDEKPKDLLQQTSDRSKAVESGIEDLIKKLEEMKKQGQGQSSDEPKPQQDNKPGQQPRPNQNRRDNQNPDFVQQPPQPGEQPDPQGQKQDQPGPKPKPQPQGNPQDGPEKHSDTGQNKPGNRQPEPNLGPGQRGAGDDSWGELQPYVNFLKNRGSPPKVPDKFRKYWEAYLKQKPDGSPGGDGK